MTRRQRFHAAWRLSALAERRRHRWLRREAMGPLVDALDVWKRAFTHPVSDLWHQTPALLMLTTRHHLDDEINFPAASPDDGKVKLRWLPYSLGGRP